MTSPSWSPRAYLWDGGYVGVGRFDGVLPLHSHHAIQVVLCLDGTVGLHTGDGQWQPYQGVIVAADVPHSFDGAGATVLLMFMDPGTREGAWLNKTLRKPIVAVPEQQLERCLAGLGLFAEEPLEEEAASELIAQVIQSLRVGPLPRRDMDPRITSALTSIRAMDAPRISLEEAARSVFLSPSRFAHLFRQEVGIPFRRYILWRKFARAVLLIGRGSTLSGAAHRAGFADSAHLTRTCYQMFGVAPTVLMGRGEFYEIPPPFERTGAGGDQGAGRTGPR